ncbi:MAG TPA: hypothetical protein VGR28_13540 [Candidatus Thermoplasmatota archaeon]|jgi:hypothetical protein|nr:hypothetical protein [Candidatus Thermoplasmatota archaeon]
MRALALALLAVVVAVQPAQASLGDEVTYVGLLFNVAAEGVWQASTHLGDQWLFEVATFAGTTDTCTVFGSVRSGFAGSCASGATFAVTGTEHEPVLPELSAVDVQPRVTLDYAGNEYIAAVAAA